MHNHAERLHRCSLPAPAPRHSPASSLLATPPAVPTDPEAEIHNRGHGVYEVALRNVWAMLAPTHRAVLIIPGLLAPLRRAILFHELGHIVLGHAGCMFAPLTNQRRHSNEQEAAADAWAAREMIELTALSQAYAWSTSLAELAAELEVPEHWVRIRLRDTEGLLHSSADHLLR